MQSQLETSRQCDVRTYGAQERIDVGFLQKFISWNVWLLPQWKHAQVQYSKWVVRVL